MGQESRMAQPEGTTTLQINRKFSDDQLLVKLCRNGKEWLSPVGWVKDEKGTLLDCRAEGEDSIVEIPAEFAKKIKTGDTLSLSSTGADFDAEIIWGKAPKPAKAAAKTNGATPVSHLSLEETEKRAKEAEKAADNYRSKMEAAAKAREEAQAAALAAARKADEALKAEADRIAEMEKAAKAFEEAEKLRLDEQRRLDKERRLEEERVAEAARLAEEARLKAEAELLAKERKEARKFFNSEIDKVKSEKFRLDDVLNGFKDKAAVAEADIADSDKRLERLEKSLAGAQKHEADTKASLQKEESQLSELKSRQTKVGASIDEIEKSADKLNKRLEKSEQAYDKARKEVEAAQARAAEALKALESVKTEKQNAGTGIKQLIDEKKEINEKLKAHETHLGNLKDMFGKARIVAENEQKDIKEIKSARKSLQERLTTAKSDISRTLQDIKSQDETLGRLKTSLHQIDDMENADDVRLLAGKPVTTNVKTKSVEAKKAAETAASTGLLGRFFRRGEKAEPVLRSEKPITVTARKPAEKKTDTIETVIAAKSDGLNGSSGRRLNNWLMLGVALTGAAVIGSTYALSDKDANASTIVNAKAETPAPISEVAEITKVAELSLPADPVRVMQDTKSDVTAKILEEEISEPGEETADESKTETKTEIKAASATKPIVKKKPVVKKAPVKKAADAPRNYPEITRQAQENLTYLGMYSGEPDGLQTIATQNAIREFKTLFELPVDNELTGQFLNELKRAVDDQKLLTEQAALIQEAPAIEDAPSTKLADNSGRVIVFDSV